jgi:hypothetical protein
MQFRSNLLYELLLIGIVTIVVGFISTRVLSGNKFPQFDDPKLGIMLFNYFIIGVVIHFIFEISGFNEKFCKKEFTCI